MVLIIPSLLFPISFNRVPWKSSWQIAQPFADDTFCFLPSAKSGLFPEDASFPAAHVPELFIVPFHRGLNLAFFWLPKRHSYSLRKAVRQNNATSHSASRKVSLFTRSSRAIADVAGEGRCKAQGGHHPVKGLCQVKKEFYMGENGLLCWAT
jgi:hypothetical protein